MPSLATLTCHPHLPPSLATLTCHIAQTAVTFLYRFADDTIPIRFESRL
jgi:hypothetical protein